MAKALEKKYDFLSPTAPEGYDGKGQEDITTDDILIPRIKLAQALTPEVVEKKANEGDLIHNITGEVLCPAGERLLFIPILYTKEFIIWRERETGGGIIARARRVIDGDKIRYRWDKPYTEQRDKIGGKVEIKYNLKKYTTNIMAGVDDETDDLACWKDEGGERIAPHAQMTHNYLIVLPTRDMELIALSLSRTSAKKGDQLNTMLKMGGRSIFTRVFEASTYMDQSDQYRFANWIFSPAGFVAQEKTQMLQDLEKLHDDFKQSNFQIILEDSEHKEPEEGF